MKKTAMLLAMLMLISLLLLPGKTAFAADAETEFDPAKCQLLYLESRSTETLNGNLYVYLTKMERQNQVLFLHLMLVNDTNVDFHLWYPAVYVNGGDAVKVSGEIKVTSGAQQAGQIVVNLDSREFRDIDLVSVESFELSYALSYNNTTIQSWVTKSAISDLSCLKNDTLPATARTDEVQEDESVPAENAESDEATDETFGDQEAFLTDMAAGITARLEFSSENDSSVGSMSDEEKIAYHRRCVSLEWDQIGKYEDVFFADSRFNQLVHTYLDACKMQLTAYDFFRSYDVRFNLWGAGRAARGSIILYFYENYGLPITSAQADQYRG